MQRTRTSCRWGSCLRCALQCMSEREHLHWPRACHKTSAVESRRTGMSVETPVSCPSRPPSMVKLALERGMRGGEQLTCNSVSATMLVEDHRLRCRRLCRRRWRAPGEPRCPRRRSRRMTRRSPRWTGLPRELPGDGKLPAVGTRKAAVSQRAGHTARRTDLVPRSSNRTRPKHCSGPMQ